MSDEELLKDYMLNHDEVKKMADKQLEEDKILEMYNKFYNPEEEKEQRYIENILREVRNCENEEQMQKILDKVKKDEGITIKTSARIVMLIEKEIKSRSESKKAEFKNKYKVENIGILGNKPKENQTNNESIDKTERE